MPRTAERVPIPVEQIEIVSSRIPCSHPQLSGRRRRLCHRCHPRSSLLLVLLLLVGVEVGMVAMETAMGVETRTDRVFHHRPTTTWPPVVFFPPPPPHLSRKYISESPYYSSSSSSFLAPPPPRHLHCLLLTRARKERGMAVSSQRPALAEAGGRPRRRATRPRWSRSSFPRKKKKEERFDVICVFF